MHRAGIPVPRTLYTSSAAAARAFRAEVGPSIVKPIAGGAHTRDFDSPDVQATLHLIHRAPIVVQERVYGQHLRVTVVGGEIVSAVVIESEMLDYRDDPQYHQAATYREAELSEEGRAIALGAAAASRLSYTGIDILRHGDRHVVLECNTSPIYLDIERRIGHPISAKLAAFLYQSASRSAS
jgi:glutathione synthase/RimK-type ligase-like ATP-grasp enzyme